MLVKQLLLGAILITSINTFAFADPLFTNGSLRGEYLITLIEIRQETAGIDYCDITARAKFDGSGNVTIDSTRKCSLSGTVSSSGPGFYDVRPSGEFTISEAVGGDATHGRIAHSGRTILLDGTTRTNPDVLVQNGVGALKR